MKLRLNVLMVVTEEALLSSAKKKQTAVKLSAVKCYSEAGEIVKEERPSVLIT